ncbi:MAG: tRNA pseudouridine(38-40) synthase TruA [Planctomycetaceae bacterium]|jgi:tRNA pseudouridine38-40 synthase|nr:tRNA pseudouridine(38-40) synthase TruA [Planctomycetaceae bacterium]
MRRIKLEIAYDGTHYHGWQRQNDAASIQETIEKTLTKITGRPIRITGSGRTDAGVHALKQTAAFSTDSNLPAEVFYRALNGFLPPDIRILSAAEVPMSFHPINDAAAKRYRYLIDDNRPPSPLTRNYCWVYRERLDAAAMQAAAQHLLGTHDFACFQTQGSPRKTTVRTVSAVLVERIAVTKDMPTMYSPLIRIEVEADGFLYNMMRTIAGTLVLLGTESRRRNVKTLPLQTVMESKDRRLAGPTAPAHGLYLVDVRYGS